MTSAAASIAFAQTQPAGSKPVRGIPVEYLGDWICQTAVPGYNLRPPHADTSQPLTSNLTTPPSVRILKFSLLKDGVYESSGAKGHYAFDAALNAINWLDGSHASSFSRTEVGKRDDGAPKMGLVVNKRYYGCFKPKPRAS